MSAQPPTLFRETGADGVCIVTFDRPGSGANIFDWTTLEQLAKHLDAIAADPAIVSVIFTSAKSSIFIAGADLHSLATLGDGELNRFIQLGQDVFDKLAALKVPTVAAIHGACVGGGYEFCLACTYRIASTDRVTRIGLPETKLGILPAWGGSTRLPRLIGIRRALDIILGGKTPSARQARRLDMVDETAPREQLVDAARAILLNRPKRSFGWVKAEAMIAPLVQPMIRRQVLKRTRGHYPALLKALDVVIDGMSGSVQRSLALERSAVAELFHTDACRNLVRLFFLQDRAKKLVVEGAEKSKGRIQRAAVIGAGVMGSAIAQWLSARGLRVILRDIDAPRVAAGMGGIAKLFAAGVKRHVFTGIEARDSLDRISPAESNVPLNRVELVIEAIVEKMDVKKRLLGDLARDVAPATIIATNTSALSVSEMGEATADPSRVVGIHFFNPVHSMQLVEVVLGKTTSPETAQRAVAFVQQIGKLPVVVKDRPGFVVNRILLPYLLEAGRLFEQGASVQDVDLAMLDFGMPMGPLRLIDEVGVDVAADVAATLARNFPERLSVPIILTRLLEAKLLGKKTRSGFYLHTRTAKPNPGVLAYQTSNYSAGMSRKDLQRRMVLLMVTESARCLEEGVVASPSDIDFAMVMGTGFAPFRGGPLRYADSVGLARIVEELKELKIPPGELLARLAAEGRTFHED